MRGPATLLFLAITSCDTRHQTEQVAPVAPSPTDHRTTPPSLPPPSSTDAWARAGAENTPEAWATAAEAAHRELADCKADCRELAKTVVLARKNALGASAFQPPPGNRPVALPSQVRALVDAYDDYLTRIDPSDPEASDTDFLAASLLNRWRQPDGIARLEAFLRAHPDRPTAEYAADLLLDALVRSGPKDELKAWTDRLLADSAFLADKANLKRMLEQIDSEIDL